jgi:hypothetical protein
MALWLVRAGKHGEYEEKFFSEGRVYLTWDIGDDMRSASDADQIKRFSLLPPRPHPQRS